jgi:hypothetical protein
MLLLTLICSCKSKEPNVEIDKPFNILRNNFKSTLTKKIKAPQYFSDFTEPPKDVSVVKYLSEGRELKGLIHTTNIDSTKRTKAIVYLHGGFSLSYTDINECQPFIDAGYVVFAPTYRGENGNDGDFEYFFGEVSDAENSVKWLSKQNYIDSNNIFVFGHSIGGGMSTLLSLNNNCPSKLNGSCSGLYIKEWLSELIGEENIPFNSTIEEEYTFRCPIYMLDYLSRRHVMYMGVEDYYSFFNSTIIGMYDTKPQNFDFIEMPGDHHSSLKPSMIEFLKEIEKTM